MVLSGKKKTYLTKYSYCPSFNFVLNEIAYKCTILLTYRKVLTSLFHEIICLTRVLPFKIYKEFFNIKSEHPHRINKILFSLLIWPATEKKLNFIVSHQPPPSPSNIKSKYCPHRIKSPKTLWNVRLHQLGERNPPVKFWNLKSMTKVFVCLFFWKRNTALMKHDINKLSTISKTHEMNINSKKATRIF